MIAPHEYFINLVGYLLLWRCPAVLGETTYKPSRTREDEAIDRHHTLTIGNFSGHSLLLGLLEALESISHYTNALDARKSTDAQFMRSIAQLKMGAASIRYERKSKVRFQIGRHTGENLSMWSWQNEEPAFIGWKFTGVIRGGRLNQKLVDWLQQCVKGRIDYFSITFDRWALRYETPFIPDAVFEMNLDRNMKLACVELGEHCLKVKEGGSSTASEELDVSSLTLLDQDVLCYDSGVDFDDAQPKLEDYAPRMTDPARSNTICASRFVQIRRCRRIGVRFTWSIGRPETQLRRRCAEQWRRQLCQRDCR